MSEVGAVHPEWDAASCTLTLWLENPARANALNFAMLTTIAETLEISDDEIAQIVLRGAGGRFSSGVDLSQRTLPASAGATVQDALDRATAAIRRCPAPVVALIERFCIGAALEVAVSCDVRVAVRPARFQMPATRIGAVYRSGGYDALLRRLEPTVVRQLLLLGMRLDADAACQRGIVDAVHDSDEDAVGNVRELLADMPRPAFHAQKLALDAALASRSLDPRQEQIITDLRRHGARFGQENNQHAAS